MTRIFECVRVAAAILLAVIGLRMLLQVVSALKGGEHHSSVEAFLVVQTILLSCSLLATAYLLAFHRYRKAAVTVLILSLLGWLPSVLRLVR